VLDLAGVPAPEAVAGVPQRPFHGVSLRPALSAADAPSGRDTQYFEMNGYRAIYREGWRAVCSFGGPSLAEAEARGRNFRFTELTRELLDEMDLEWELYDVVDDPGETVDLAAKDPDRLDRMVQLWYAEAERYDVLPIAAARGRAVGPRLGAPRRLRYELYAGAAPLSFTVAPRLAGRPHTVTAEVVIPTGVPAEGIVLAQGGRQVGFALYLLDGRLHHVHNYAGLDWFTVSSPERVAAGPHVLRYEFQPTGPPVDLLHGKGVPARSKLYVDGTLVACLELPYSLVAGFGFFGLTCGYAVPDAVDPSRWRPPFRCTTGI